MSTRTLFETATQVVGWARASRPETGARYVCATSVHGLIEGTRDPEFARILNGAAVVTPDGMPLVWVGRLSAFPQMSRVYGPDLMRQVCELAVPHGIRHFLYGGAPGVVDELARWMTSTFPGLTVSGTLSPPFRPLSQGELDDAVAQINASSSDIVWVGLGTPKQERWAAAVSGRLNVKVLVTVGAAFDFHTGRVRQAPHWMRRLGLEWLFRLVQEPRRLWRRYLYNNPRFVILAGLQLLRGRRSRDLK